MSITKILKVLSVLITVWFFGFFDKTHAAELWIPSCRSLEAADFTWTKNDRSQGTTSGISVM